MCPSEILAFNDALPQFKALGASVLGLIFSLSVLFNLPDSTIDVLRYIHRFQILPFCLVDPTAEDWGFRT